MATQITRVPKPYWFGSFSDHALMQELRVSHEQDRQHTARLIALLAEVDRRRLHREQGFASLFKYCTRALHMSEDMAWKRIQVARAARRHPEIFERLADGRLTLTATLLLDQHLTRENAVELLDAATHPSKNAVLELLASRFPRPDLASLITSMACVPVAPVVHPPVASDSQTPHVQSCATTPAPERVPEMSCVQVAASVASPVSLPAPPPRVTPLAPERFALQVTLSRETREKLRRAQQLLGHAFPDGDIAQVLDRALGVLIQKLEGRRCGATTTPRRRASDTHGRHVASELKRQVYERDQHRCAFISSTGQRCEARAMLEIDHMTPIAKGGRTELANLRLLCRAHNQLAAEQVLGAGFMEMKRRGAVRERATNRGAYGDAHESAADPRVSR